MRQDNNSLAIMKHIFYCFVKLIFYLRDSRQEFAKVGGIFPIFHAVVLLRGSSNKEWDFFYGAVN